MTPAIAPAEEFGAEMLEALRERAFPNFAGAVERAIAEAEVTEDDELVALPRGPLRDAVVQDVEPILRRAARRVRGTTPAEWSTGASEGFLDNSLDALARGRDAHGAWAEDGWRFTHEAEQSDDFEGEDGADDEPPEELH